VSAAKVDPGVDGRQSRVPATAHYGHLENENINTSRDATIIQIQDRNLPK
jgi:hypothetical protein